MQLRGFMFLFFDPDTHRANPLSATLDTPGLPEEPVRQTVRLVPAPPHQEEAALPPLLPLGDREQLRVQLCTSEAEAVLMTTVVEVRSLGGGRATFGISSSDVGSSMFSQAL